MVEVDSLGIQIKADATQAGKEIDSLVGKLEKLTANFRKVSAASSASMGGASKGPSNEFNNVIKGIDGVTKAAKNSTKAIENYALSFASLYAKVKSLNMAFNAVKDSVNNTADYVESFNYFTVAMGKIASKWDKQWEEYADDNARNYSNKFFVTLNDTFKKLSGVSYDPETGLLSETGLKNLGLNLQEVTQYAAQLGSMMDAVGQSGETTLATTNAFVKLAGDISSLYNIDYAKAAEKIRSVLQGQSRAGYGFGWDTTMASLQATADKYGLTKAVSEMSQMEKQQLRILTILEQSRVAWGDQANTINTVANQLRIFKNNTREIGMLLGQLFIPMLQRVIPYINGFSIAVKRLLTDLAGLMGIKIEDIGQGFGDMSDDLDNVTESAQKAKASLRGFDELKVISLPEVDKMSDILGGQVDLSDEIAAATKEYEEYWQNAMNDMKSRAEELATAISNAFDFENIAKNVSILFDSVKGFADAIKPFISGFGDGFLGYLKSLGDISLNTFVNGLNSLSDALGIVPDKTLEGVGQKLGILAGSIATLVGIKNIASTFNALSTGLSNLGKTLLSNPILATFALATGILTLIDIADKKTELAVSIEMGDLISDLEELEDAIERTKDDLGNVEDSLVTVDNKKLKNIYKEWKKLNGKVGELTDVEKGLLKAYGDVLKTNFEEAIPYIDDNGRAYGRLADELDGVIDRAILLSSIQAADELTTKAAMVKIQADIDLESAEKALDDIFEHIREKLPELSSEEIQKSLDSFLSGKGLLPQGKDVALSPIGVAFERNPEKFDVNYFNKDQVLLKETAILVEEFEKYADALGIRNQAEKNATSAASNLYSITEKAKELNKEYADSIAEAERKTQSFNFAISKTAKKHFPKLIDQLEILTSKTGEAKTVLEKFYLALDSINGKEVSATINLNTKGEVVEIKRPGLVITPYAKGGFPEDGLFMANHNELVGQFSNGKTAVANNQQITQGIADAVYPAVYNAVTAAFSNKGTEPIRVFVGDRELTDIVVDGINQRTRAGRQPLYGW